MTLRLFTCLDCGHKMRLRGARCGACHAKKKPWQRLGVIPSLATLGVLIGLVTIATT